MRGLPMLPRHFQRFSKRVIDDQHVCSVIVVAFEEHCNTVCYTHNLRCDGLPRRAARHMNGHVLVVITRVVIAAQRRITAPR